MRLIQGKAATSIATSAYAVLESWIFAGVVDASSTSPSLSVIILRFTPLTFLLPSIPFWERGNAERELSLSIAPIVGWGEFASPGPYLLYKTVLNFRKRIHCSPTTEIVIHSLPLGIFCRQQPPLAAAYIYVYYSVKHEKEIIFAAPILIQNCSSYILLLSIGQIGQIHIGPTAGMREAMLRALWIKSMPSAWRFPM